MSAIGPFARWAAHMLRGGYSPVPLRPDTGLPAVKRWNDLRLKPMDRGRIDWFARRLPDLGLAVAGGLGGLVPIDVDTDHPNVLDAIASALPEPVVIRRGSKGFAAFYRGSDDAVVGRKFMLRAPDARPLVEVLGTGSCTIPPTAHRKTRQPYQWLTKATLLNTRVDELSEIGPAHLAALDAALAPWCPPKPVYVAPVVADRTPFSDKRMQACADKELDRQVSKLAGLTSGRHDGAYRAACAVGKFVRGGFLSVDEIERALMGACATNKLTVARGADHCRLQIANGIKKGSGDTLPVLADRPRPAMRYQQAAGV